MPRVAMPWLDAHVISAISTVWPIGPLDAMARRVPRLLFAPCLVMMFMLGAIGLLGYHVVRARAKEPLDVAVFAPVSKAH